jgi:hypothetical protein
MIRALLLTVTLAFASTAPALAGGPPPSIDEIDGATFAVVASGPEYDLNGNVFRLANPITMTITKSDANVVSFDSVYGGMGFSAYYVDGFLMQSTASAESPPEQGSSFHAAITGQPGKLRLRGELIVFSAPPGGFQVLRVLKVSGRQIQN